MEGGFYDFESHELKMYRYIRKTKPENWRSIAVSVIFDYHDEVYDVHSEAYLRRIDRATAFNEIVGTSWIKFVKL